MLQYMSTYKGNIIELIDYALVYSFFFFLVGR